MIYLDNSATGGFKPNSVIEAVCTVVKYLSANPGRSAHRLSLTGANIVYDCRKELANLFSCTPERVIFTKNCTEALNQAIFGTVRKNGHVITTIYEHNSVLRPLYRLAEQNLITLSIVSPKENIPLEQVIENEIRENTYMVATTSASNVTGEVLPIHKIGMLCKKYNLLYLVDGAQGGGHMPISLERDNISMLALAGHKGLYGIMGSGALLLCDSVSVQPITFGGTGIATFNHNQPDEYPERLECGTLNLPAIAGLKEGVLFTKKHLTNFAERLENITEKVITELQKLNNVIVYSKPNPTGIVSFNLENYDASTVCDILNLEFDIAVRGGAHCAPLMHEFLSTKEKGIIRASIAVQNSGNELNCFINAIKNIASR